MLKPIALGSALLLSTALTAPAAFAQGGAPNASPPTSTPPSSEAVDEPSDEPGTNVDTEGDEQVDVSIPGADPATDAPPTGEEVVVTGTRRPNLVRRTPEVVNVLSSEDIARTGDGDIAGALQRVTGLSVVGNGFVFVRGLGDRYSLALLNGLALPSPEPLRRVVPLDIFPTSVLASAFVQKSFSTNFPAEFGGGVINLTTSQVPNEDFFGVGASVGVNTVTTAKLGYTYFGSDSDFTGFDDGARDVPGPLQAAFNRNALIAPGNTFSNADIAGITTSLNNQNSLLQRNGDIPADFGIDLSAGASTEVGDGATLGLIANAGYSNSWRTRDALQQTGGDDIIGTEFRAVRTDNRLIANGLLGVGLEVGEHDFRLTGLYVRDTLKQGRLAAGFSRSVSDPVEGQPAQLLRQRTAWFERQLINTQAVAELNFDAFEVDVRGGYANSQRESPYERNFSYLFDSGLRDYVNNLVGTGQSASVSFSDLEEDVYNAGIDISFRSDNDDIPFTLGIGYAYLDQARSSVRRDFAFRPLNSLPSFVAQQRPDFLLSDFNVTNFGIQLLETSGLAGAAAFDADLRVHGVYYQVNAEITPDLRVQAGVRFEAAEESVTLIDLFNQGGIIQTDPIEEEEFFPAATLTYNLAEDMQLRLHASRTIARPQFRELAPQLYLDIESDRQFFGNPFLIDTDLYNAEARYEWYFARDQRFSVAGFYKKLESPIEAIAQFFANDQLQTTFANAPEADLYGAEFELQYYLPLENVIGGDFFNTRRLVTIANYTFSESSINVGDGDTTILNDTQGERPALTVFRDGDRLTGQSRHLANLQFGLENRGRLSQQTILVNYASSRVSNRGPLLGTGRQPDVIEEPGLRLDLVLREGFNLLGADMELKLEARNLLGDNFEEFQQFETRRLETNTYRLGRSYSLGLSARF